MFNGILPVFRIKKEVLSFDNPDNACFCPNVEECVEVVLIIDTYIFFVFCFVCKFIGLTRRGYLVQFHVLQTQKLANRSKFLVLLYMQPKSQTFWIFQNTRCHCQNLKYQVDTIRLQSCLRVCKLKVDGSVQFI